MVTFRNNRRGRFRGGDRNFKRNNGESHKFKSDFSTNTNFQRKTPGRNNHNASKLITKYNDLAREALANGDKILSENYFQHADHFIRIIEEQEKNKPSRNLENSNKNELNENNLENDQNKSKEAINN
jgi:hypothetical protein|tara:strand:+ start:294 stop:674 length:381 start_codon:yes stop_codon:yes gene_type:complete